jgi:hypothetical protein
MPGVSGQMVNAFFILLILNVHVISRANSHTPGLSGVAFNQGSRQGDGGGGKNKLRRIL